MEIKLRSTEDKSWPEQDLNGNSPWTDPFTAENAHSCECLSVFKLPVGYPLL